MTTTETENEDAPDGEAASADVALPEEGGGELVPADADKGALVPASAGGGGSGPTEHTALLEPAEDPRAEAVRTRVLLPLLMPIAAAAALFFYVINLSRALLAGGEWGSLVIASILVLGILGVVAWISAHPNLRTSTLAVMLTLMFLFIGAAGLTSLGPSEDKGGAASGPTFKEPKGDPVATVEVDAQPGAALAFQSTNFDTPAGINEIKYVLGNGNHTLAFTEKEFSGFLLAVGGTKKVDSGKVELTAGTTYTIYCTIPGHRAAGMEATITVSEGTSTTATTAG